MGIKIHKWISTNITQNPPNKRESAHIQTKKVEKNKIKAEKAQATPPPGPTTPTRKEPSPPKPTLKPNIQPEPLSPATNPEPIEDPPGKIGNSDTKIRTSNIVNGLVHG